MEETLENNSSIGWKKSKFFINRVVIYFGFLLIPSWIHKSLELSIFSQSLIMFAYILFLGGQWYLLGKEVDHRLKIYFRANSSIDRILYRLIIGNTTMLILFNVMSFIPSSIVNHFFWGFFVLFGLFYSWPTRGKIIQESVSTQFTEYKYLDSFEKTVLFLTIATFFVSMPSFPFVSNLETFKFIIDSDEKMHTGIWNYLYLVFYPFRRFPHLMNLGWSMYFYFVSFSLYMLALYGILRFFVSRRLSLLGLFALVSTWSFALFLKRDIYSCASTTFSVLWVWSILWCMKSSTYRSGLMYGLLCFFGVTLNYNHMFAFPVGLALMYFYFLRETTDWYRSQFMKYSSLGFFLIVLSLITQIDITLFEGVMSISKLGSYFKIIVERKAFYSLSLIGLGITLLLVFGRAKKIFGDFKIERSRLRDLLILVLCVVLLSMLVDQDYIRNFGGLWIAVVFSILPLEWIFQSISRLRSRRNFIYLVYILLCLLDSHFEGRVRLLYNFYQSPPDMIEYLNR